MKKVFIGVFIDLKCPICGAILKDCPIEEFILKIQMCPRCNVELEKI